MTAPAKPLLRWEVRRIDRAIRDAATRERKAEAAAKRAAHVAENGYEATKDRRTEERQIQRAQDQLDMILDCEALWAIDPNSPIALQMLLTRVPAEVRHACLDLPWEACPVRRILGEGSHRLEAIGDAYALSRERIRQLESDALRRALPAIKRNQIDFPEPKRLSNWEMMCGI